MSQTALDFGAGPSPAPPEIPLWAELEFVSLPEACETAIRVLTEDQRGLLAARMVGLTAPEVIALIQRTLDRQVGPAVYPWSARRKSWLEVAP